MPNLSYVIGSDPDLRIVPGDDAELNITVTNIAVGDTVSQAWFTVKRALSPYPLVVPAPDDADALFQKIITTTDVVGVGHVVDTDPADGLAYVRVDLLPADTALLDSTLYFSVNFDLQVRLSSGKIKTPLKGEIICATQVTRAT